MEIEFGGKRWFLTTSDEYGDPRGPACEMTLDAIQEAREAEKAGRTEEAARLTFTAEWLLEKFWFNADDEGDE